MKIENFPQKLNDEIKKLYRTTPADAKNYMLHNAVSSVVMNEIGEKWQECSEKTLNTRRCFYF